MEKIGFIGSFDKTDLLIYIAKVFTLIGKKVLVIDTTLVEKVRYIVPVINPTKSYVTEYEKIDVAVGFENYQEIKRYLGIEEHQELEYDLVLLDIDTIECFASFEIKDCNKKYFVTSFDLYSLKRGLEVLAGIKEPIELTKILFSKDILKEEDEYLNYVSLGYKILWNNEYRIYFPFDNGDQSILIENQRVSKIGIRKLSQQFKDSLMYLVEDIAGNLASSDIKKAFKMIEKGV